MAVRSVAVKSAGRAEGGQRAGRSPVPTTADPSRVRNVVLVGPSGSGKTTLVEALLARTAAIPRPGSVVEGTTVCDHDPAAVRQQRSVALSVAPLLHEDVKINLIDTPGYGDFVGELRAGLRAADAALFVVAATEGREGAVDPATVAQWEECAAVGMPRAVVIARCDHPRADLEATIDRMPGRLRGRCRTPLPADPGRRPARLASTACSRRPPSTARRPMPRTPAVR